MVKYEDFPYKKKTNKQIAFSSVHQSGYRTSSLRRTKKGINPLLTAVRRQLAEKERQRLEQSHKEMGKCFSSAATAAWLIRQAKQSSIQAVAQLPPGERCKNGRKSIVRCIIEKKKNEKKAGSKNIIR